MRKFLFGTMLAMLLLAGSAVQAAPIPVKITVGNKTSDGYIVSRDKELITFRMTGMSGDVSYPVDAIKQIQFPVKVDESVVGSMIQNRMHEQLAATLEAALEPYVEYNDLPSNITKYQGVLMELFYKIGNYQKSMSYASQLLAHVRDPQLERKGVVYQGLSLLSAGRLEEAEALFAKQGWTGDPGEDAGAEDLYITAKFHFMKKDYPKAIETAAKIIAFHSQDPDWMRPAELLCAEIYMAMAKAYNHPDFLDSADEVIREITLLYRDTDAADQAQSLKLKADALRFEINAGSEE